MVKITFLSLEESVSPKITQRFYTHTLDPSPFSILECRLQICFVPKSSFHATIWHQYHVRNWYLIWICIWMHTWTHIYLPTYLPTCQPTNQPTYLPTYLPTYIIHTNVDKTCICVCIFNSHSPQCQWIVVVFIYRASKRRDVRTWYNQLGLALGNLILSEWNRGLRPYMF